MNYKILNKINSSIKSDNINKIYEYFINCDRQIIESEINLDNPKLLWFLRKYINANDFIDELEDIECYLFRNKIDGDLYIFSKLYNLIECETIDNEYKSNKIDNNILNKLEIFYELYEVIINIYNNLNKDKFLLIRKEFKNMYENIKTIIIKYNGF